MLFAEYVVPSSQSTFTGLRMIALSTSSRVLVRIMF